MAQKNATPSRKQAAVLERHDRQAPDIGRNQGDRQMKTLNIIDTKFPEPDSQFRLRPCRCRCENVGYLRIRADGREPWVVRCDRCGETTGPFQVRHDAQVFWNTNMVAMPTVRRAI